MADILTPEQKAALAAELADQKYDGLSDSACAALLNTPEVTVTTTQAPRPFTRYDVLGLLSAQSKGNVMSLPIAPKVIEALNLNDHASVIEYADSLKNVNLLTSEEFLAIYAVLTQTVDVESREYGPTPFQTLFPGAVFHITEGDGPLTITRTVSGTCLPEMIAEARN